MDQGFLNGFGQGLLKSTVFWILFPILFAFVLPRLFKAHRESTSRIIFVIIFLFFIFLFIPFIKINNEYHSFFDLASIDNIAFIIPFIGYPLALIFLIARKRVLSWMSGWMFFSCFAALFWGVIKYLPETAQYEGLFIALFLIFFFGSLIALLFYTAIAATYYSQKEKGQVLDRFRQFFGKNIKW